MTTEKMPDVIVCGKHNSWYRPEDSKNSNLTKYIRTEPAEALLKSARDAMHKMIGPFSDDPGGHATATHICAQTIFAIDKFLGDK